MMQCSRHRHRSVMNTSCAIETELGAREEFDEVCAGEVEEEALVAHPEIS